MDPSSTIDSSKLGIFCARPEGQIDPINEKTSEYIPSIVQLPLNPVWELFQLAVKEGLLTPEGLPGNISTGCMPRLPTSSIKLLQETLNQFGILAALNHISKDLMDLRIDNHNMIKVIGSSVFWILGREYMTTLCKEAGLDINALPAEFLDRIFKKPADIDIRIDLRSISTEALILIGNKIKAYLLQSKKLIDGESGPYISDNICYNITHIKNNKNDTFTADIVIASNLTLDCLSAADDCNIVIPVQCLKALQSASNHASIFIFPSGAICAGRYALFIKLLCLWLASEWYEKINLRGAIKYLITSTDGKTPLQTELHTKLSHLVFDAMSEKPKEIMDKVLNLVLKHMPSNPSYLLVSLLNILGLKLAENRNPAREAEIKKPVLSILHNNHIAKSIIPLSKPFEALQHLMCSNDLPISVLRDFLLIHCHLLMAQKLDGINKNSKLSAYINFHAGRPVTFLNIHEEDISIMLNYGLQSALKTFIDYLNSRAESGKIDSYFNTLSHLFLKDIPLIYPTAKNNLVASSTADNPEMCSELLMVSKSAETLLKHKHFKSLGFMLLCQSNKAMGLKTQLKTLSIGLLPLLIEIECPIQRVAILRQYLDYLKYCHPKDGIFQHADKIDAFLTYLSLPLSAATMDAKQLKKKFCDTFSYSHVCYLAAVILEEIKSEDRKTLFKTAKETLEKYLSLKPPATLIALPIFVLICNNHQIPYNVLAPYLNRIITNYDSQKRLIDGKLLFNAAKELLKRKSQTDSNDNNSIYLELVDYTLKNEETDNAIDLLDAAVSKGIFKNLSELLCLFRFRCCQAALSKKEHVKAFIQWQKGLCQYTESNKSESNENETLLDTLFSIHLTSIDHRLQKEVIMILLAEGDIKALKDWIKTNKLDLHASSLSADMMIQPLFQLPTDHTKQLEDAWESIYTSGIINNLSPENCRKLLLLMSSFYADKITNNDPIKLFGRMGSWLLKQLQTYGNNENSKSFDTHLNGYFEISSKLDLEYKDPFQNIIGAYCFRAFIKLRYPPEEMVLDLSAPKKEVQTSALDLLSSLRPIERMHGFLLLCHPDISNIIHLAQLFKILPILLTNEELTDHRSNLYAKFCQYLKKFAPNLFQTSNLEKFNNIITSECRVEEIQQAFCETFATSEDEIYFQIIFEVWKGMHEGKESTALSLICRYQKTLPTNALKILCEQLDTGKSSLQIIQAHWLLFLETPDQGHLEALVKIALWLITKNQTEKDFLPDHLFKLIELCCKFNEFNHAHTIYEAAKSKSLFPNLQKYNLTPWKQLCTQYFAAEKLTEAYALSEKLIESKDPDLITDLLLKVNEKHRNDKLITLFLKVLTLPMPSKVASELAGIIIKYILEIKTSSSELMQNFSLHASKLISILHSELNESPTPSKSKDLCSTLQLMLTHQLEVSLIINALELWPALQNLHETTPEEFDALSLQLLNAPDKHIKEDQDQKALFYFFLAQRNLNNVSILNACLRRALGGLKADISPTTEQCMLFDSYLSAMINQNGLKLAQEMLEILTKKWSSQKPLWIDEHWKVLAIAAEKMMPVLAARILMEKGSFTTSTDDLELPLNICMNLLAIKIPSADNLAISLAAQYNINLTQFWILALPICLPSVPGAMTQIEQFCSERSFSGPQEECQACWQIMLKLIKEHKISLMLPLLNKLNHILSSYSEEQKYLKGQFALSFNNGLLTLLLDHDLNESDVQKLREKIPDIFEISHAIVSHEELLEFKLRVIRYRLSTKGDQKIALSINLLSEYIVLTSSPFYKQYENLFIQALDLYISKALDDDEALSQIFKIIDHLNGAIDPIKILQLYASKIDVDYYKKILTILFPNANWKICPLKPAQKKIVTAVIDKVFLWLCDNPVEFNRFLIGIEKTGILTKSHLSHWLAHEESRKLNSALHFIKNENVPFQTKIASAAQALDLFCEQIEKIQCGEENARQCIFEATTLLFFLQKSTLDPEFFLSEANRKTVLISGHFFRKCLPLLRKFIHATVNLSTNAIKSVWNKKLDGILVNWKQISEEHQAAEGFYVLFLLCNEELAKLHEALMLPEPNRSSVPKIQAKQGQAARRQNAVEKIPSTKFDENAYFFVFLRTFIFQSINEMLNYTPKNTNEQCSIFSYLIFYTGILESIFPFDKALGQILEDILFSKIYPTNELFMIQRLLVIILHIKSERDLPYMRNNFKQYQNRNLLLQRDLFVPKMFQKSFEDLRVEQVSDLILRSCNLQSPKNLTALPLLSKFQLFLNSPALLVQCYSAVFHSIVRDNPFWLLPLEDNASTSPWEMLNQNLSNLAKVVFDGAIMEKKLAQVPNYHALVVSVENYLVLFAEMTLTLYKSDDLQKNEKTLEILLDIINCFHFKTQSSLPQYLSLIASAMPLAAKFPNIHEHFFSAITMHLIDCPDLFHHFIPYLDLWIKCLNDQNYTKESREILDSKCYALMLKAKSELPTGQLHDMSLITHFRSSMDAFFDFIVEAYIEKSNEGYKLLMQKLDEIKLQPLWHTPQLEIERQITELRLMARMLPLGVHESEEELTKITGMLCNFCNSNSTYERFAPEIIYALDIWMRLLKDFEKTTEIMKMINMKSIHDLFFNSPQLTRPFFNKVFIELIASPEIFYSGVLSPKEAYLESIIYVMLKIKFKVFKVNANSELENLEVTSNWKWIGGLLIQHNEFFSPISAAIIKEHLAVYFKMMVYLSIPQLEGKAFKSEPLKLGTFFLPAFSTIEKILGDSLTLDENIRQRQRRNNFSTLTFLLQLLGDMQMKSEYKTNFGFTLSLYEIIMPLAIELGPDAMDTFFKAFQAYFMTLKPLDVDHGINCNLTAKECYYLIFSQWNQLTNKKLEEIRNQ